MRDKQKDAMYLVADIGNLDNLVNFDEESPEFTCFYNALDGAKATTRLWQDRITKLKERCE